MNRHNSLHEITGLMGDALKGLESKGIETDHRSIRLFVDAFCDLYKAQGETEFFMGAKGLVTSVLEDETNHGGLLSRETLRKAGVLKLEMGK